MAVYRKSPSYCSYYGNYCCFRRSHRCLVII
nr:MAG TPA: hypothetical protein [Caudoviricetes sp.]